jgi:hypothetical protein
MRFRGWRPRLVEELLLKSVVLGIMLALLSGLWYTRYEDQYVIQTSFGAPEPWLIHTLPKLRLNSPDVPPEGVALRLEGLTTDVVFFEVVVVGVTLAVMAFVKRRRGATYRPQRSSTEVQG